MSQDDQKQLSQKKETPVQGSKIGSFIQILKDIVKPLFNSIKDIVKLLFNSVIDIPQHHTLKQQKQLEEMQNRQDLDASGKGHKEKLEAEKTALDISGKSPEDLNQAEVEKAGKGLKEKMIKSSGASDRPTEVESPGETPAKDVDPDSQKSIER